MPVWSLKRRMLLLNVGFLSAAIVLLGFFFYNTQQNILERFLFERGMSASAQLALVSGAVSEEQADEALLQNLASVVLEEHLVRSVSIHINELPRTVHSGPGMLPALNERKSNNSSVVIIETEGSYRFLSPIVFDQGSAQWSEEQMGWVEVEYANYPLIIRMFELLLTAGGIVLGLLISLIALALYFSANYSRKVDGILAAVDGASTSTLTSNIEVAGDRDELDLISAKLNNMWAQFHNTQKEAERSAAQTTRDLRETLETLEVQNIELDLARKEAINASHVKSEFLANTSHEIRTPLNGIIGFTNLILKTPLSDKQTDYVSTIRQSANGLLRIINDILDFSKIEAGKLVLDYITINLFDLLEETMTLMAPMSNDKDIVLSILYQPDVPEFVTGDPQRLQQIMTNLVHNAIKFTDAGYVQIEVTGVSAEEIEVSVSDTGIGMSDEQQRNLFNAFSQGDRSVSRNYGGTGLGLVIAQRLVEQMGSSIALYSQEGEGSTFKFSLHTKAVSQQGDPIELEDLDLAYMHPDIGLSESLQQIFARWKLTTTKLGSPSDGVDYLASHEDGKLALVIGVNEANLRSQMDLQALNKLALSEKMVLLCPREQQSRAQSKLNIDPKFVLTTPLRRSELHDALVQLCQPENQSSEHLVNRKQLNQPPKPRGLIVDDNPANLKLLRLMLEQEDFNCLPVEGGAEAIALADQEAFEMIFMDIQMPGISGTEATQIIRQNSKLNKGTPIIAVTAHAHTEDKNAFLRAGMNDYLGKPIMEEQLKSVLNRWSQDHKTAAEKSHVDQLPLSPPIEKHLGPVDLAQCLKLANNKPEIAQEMLTGLLESLPQQQQKILNFAESKLMEELEEAVHYLHGHACYTGVPQLRDLCASLESTLKSGLDGNEMLDIHSLLDELSNECERLLGWYEQHDLAVLFET